ncbi:hypothetical protein GCM10010466_43990 [Planomonospora alba]|uniref:Uncharacterized protein n=1 Tax=Planomonospora alba TaxID=161354 RepID=A0ABP6NHK8_9ACTN
MGNGPEGEERAGRPEKETHPGEAGRPAEEAAGETAGEDGRPGEEPAAGEEAAQEEAGRGAERAVSDATRLWRVLTNIVAPTTLVTGLMVYFGWAQSAIVYRAFGIDQSVLALSPQDYMFRSVSATMEPLAWLLFAVVVLVPLHVLLIRLLLRHRGPARWIVAGVAAAGFVLCLVAIVGSTGVIRSALPVVPMSLGLGVMLLGYAVHLRTVLVHRRFWPMGESPALRLVGRVSFAGLLILTLLWSTAVYTQLRGADIARDLLADVRRMPWAVVYSPERLHIEGPGVVERDLGGGAAGGKARYRYRYDGLRLLLRANGRYFLLPVCWTVGGVSRVVALPEEASLRLEFFRIPRGWRPRCPAASPPGPELPPPPAPGPGPGGPS